MTGVTYDTGALVAAETDSRRMWALHAGYLDEEVVPLVLPRCWLRLGAAEHARLA
jgi:hypothetical protein